LIYFFIGLIPWSADIASMHTEEFQAGQLIFRENEAGKKMYIIMSGQVEISVAGDKENIVLARMKKGDFFGEMALFVDKPRSASARALTPVQVALVESKQQLDKFLQKNPNFSAKMVAIMCERLAHTNDLLVEKAKFARDIEYRLSKTSGNDAM